MNFISTSALAKKQGVSGKELFQELEIQNYIKREKEKWNLLKKGEECGAKIIKNSRYGEYIGWPEDFKITQDKNLNKELLSISEISEKLGLSARKLNQIISELGWIEKGIKGWKITNFGIKNGGIELQHSISGAFYTKWPRGILDNSSLLKSTGKDTNEKEEILNDDFRKKFPAQYRTKDGHNVRSRGELVIDNALYEYSLAHAYERKLPVEEDVYSDFYIPAQNGGKAVYIEYWGIEEQNKYEERKKIKKEIYKKYHLNLIELENKHLDNLDDFLPRMLLEYGISVH